MGLWPRASRLGGHLIKRKIIIISFKVQKSFLGPRASTKWNDNLIFKQASLTQFSHWSICWLFLSFFFLSLFLSSFFLSLLDSNAEDEIWWHWHEKLIYRSICWFFFSSFFLSLLLFSFSLSLSLPFLTKRSILLFTAFKQLNCQFYFLQILMLKSSWRWNLMALAREAYLRVKHCEGGTYSYHISVICD